jgi:MEMO1 family protein
MKRKAIFVVLMSVLFWGLCAQGIRPIRDDVGICWDGKQFERLIDHLKSAEKETLLLPTLVAGISPHDDYLYAGSIYYRLFKKIKAKEIIIFGVTHGTVRRKIGDPRNKLILENFTYWKGPYGKVKISQLRGDIKKKLDPGYIKVSNEAHRLEHSIEAMVPFLQYYNRDIRITPIMVTGMSFDTMKKISAQLAPIITSYIEKHRLVLGKDVFFLMSADANHYGKAFDNAIYGEDERAHQRGTDRDRDIASTYLAGSMSVGKVKGLTSELWGKNYNDYKDTVWCGKYSIPFGLLTVLQVLDSSKETRTLNGKVFGYSDTYSEGVIPLKKPGFGITAPFSLKHWVGFLSAGYYLN